MIKNLFTGLLACLFTTQSLWAAASLNWGPAIQHYMDCGNPAVFTDLYRATYLILLRASAVAANNVVFQKGSINSGIIVANTVNKSLVVRRDLTTDMAYTSGSGYIVAGVPQFLAIRIQTDAPAGDKVHFFVGYATASVQEFAGTTVGNEGSGDTATDAAATFKIGNDATSGVSSMGMNVAKVMISSGVMSLAEIQEQQFFMHPTSNTLAMWDFSNTASSNTWYDLSGKGNNCTSVGIGDSIVQFPIFDGGTP